MHFDQLDPRIVGQRLTDARTSRGITQEHAAKHIGCSRPTLIAIEKGTRPPQPKEIISLANLYSKKVNELVRPGELLVDLKPHLRAVAQGMNAAEAETTQAIAALQNFVEDYHRLERLLGVELGAHVDIVSSAEDQKLPDRYVFLAALAYDRGELSEGELAAILRCDRVTAREIVENRLSATGDVLDDGSPVL